MSPTSPGTAAFVAALVALLAGCGAQLPAERAPERRGRQVRADSPAVKLAFADFFLPGATALEPSPKLLGASGKRVRISGFMAHMDPQPSGAFYLTSRPLVCDEGGAGTADLPPETVLVTVLSEAPLTVPFIPGPLDVTGTLDVGRREGADGTVSHVRLLLGGPPGPSGPAARSATSANHGEYP